MPGEDPRSLWQEVARDVFCPAAAACGERRIVLFMRTAGGELLCRERDGSTWGDLRSLGVPVARIRDSEVGPVEWPIAACGTGDGDVHLLARGPDGDLLHGIPGRNWSGFESVGVPDVYEDGPVLPAGLAGAPTACSRERGSLAAFAADGDGNLLHAPWIAGGFGPCQSLGGLSPMRQRPRPVYGAIAAFAAGVRSMGVVARDGAVGELLIKWWNSGKWGDFEPLPASPLDPLDPALSYLSPLSGPPAVCGGGAARADVFVRGPHGDLLHTFWDGRRWSTFESLGTPGVPFTAAAPACIWGRYRMDVFACAADGKLYNAWWDGNWAHVPRTR